MNILCPHCQFSKDMDDSALPPLPSKVTCPQCAEQFILEAPQITEEDPFSFSQQIGEPVPAATAPASVAPIGSATKSTDEIPAGFWLRVLAAILDSVICNIIVFVMGFGIGFLINTNNYALNEMAQLLLFGMGIVVSLFYYIFFTGYGGQTPGKMALQIKVIHNDGSDIGYGQAFVRETIGKMISYLLLCIGYLMVAFRRDKRGLHDLLASTRVIKL